jgi:AcrR family transcriptional regulator
MSRVIPLNEEMASPVDDVLGFPVEDPALYLPETAQRILEAARRLLLKGGFDALRLDAIATEAERNKAAIKYHFGNKDGLILAVVDSLDYDDCLTLASETSGATGEERLERYIAGQTRLASDGDGFLMFFDVLAHVIRDERLRPRVAALYDWYYRMNVEWLGLTDRVRAENRDGYVALMALMVAVVDGLAIQVALQPRGFDLDKAFDVLEFFLKHTLRDYLDSLDAREPALTGSPPRHERTADSSSSPHAVDSPASAGDRDSRGPSNGCRGELGR